MTSGNYRRRCPHRGVTKKTQSLVRTLASISDALRFNSHACKLPSATYSMYHSPLLCRHAAMERLNADCLEEVVSFVPTAADLLACRLVHKLWCGVVVRMVPPAPAMLAAFDAALVRQNFELALQWARIGMPGKTVEGPTSCGGCSGKTEGSSARPRMRLLEGC